MLKFCSLMVIPVLVFFYTMSFSRWLAKRAGTGAYVSAAMLGVISLGVSAVTIWRLVM